MSTLVWLRNDLRVHDNPALYHAAETGTGVLAVYVLCEAYQARHWVAPARNHFTRATLAEVKRQLAERNIPLVLLRVSTPEDIAGELLALMRACGAEQLHFNAEYPLDELERDRAVVAAVKAEGWHFKRFHDRVLLPPGSVRNGKGEPYRVFTAYKRRWLQLAQECFIAPLPAPARQPVALSDGAGGLSLEQLFAGIDQRDLSAWWPAGEQEAYRRLQQFIEQGLDGYQERRDFPAQAGTSSLSPYLALGAISPRQCLAAVLHATQGQWHSANAGANTWVSELIWREFYQHLVVDFPQVCRYRPMQAYTDAFPWRQDSALFEAWCAGQTGIPIVDAAMAQLHTTGWMHNRLRMVVAMLLTKNLRIDWRWGERYFMSQLIDGDFAANNGGWQWSASTGTDAAPYFRIFNPVSQSQRFDPDGAFIRTYLPVLSSLSARQIHQPPSTPGYPAPIVDLVSSRQQTIALFAQLNRSEAGDR